MTTWGYTLSSEENHPLDLVRNARRAEETGFEYVTISDHFHPWINQQGNSPFVWSVLGGIAAVTEQIEVGVGVTCPIIRIHPAIIAQAAATVAEMMPERFFLGVGTGELLNEHITGQRWPVIEERWDMLEEAVQIIRALWTGEMTDVHTSHYSVENAKLFNVPQTLPPIVVSAFGDKAAKRAAGIADGLWAVAPEPGIIDTYQDAGGKGRIVGEVTVCWAETKDAAVQTAHKNWPTACVPGQLMSDLPTPTHFEQAATLVTKEMVAEAVACGPDPAELVGKIQKYEKAGFTHLNFHQVGQDQEGFFRFWEKEVKPAL